MKVGDKVNGLTMISERYVKDKRGWALFRCECGNEKEIRIDRVTSGNTKYCGCHMGKHHGKANYKHGICHTRIYNIWEKIKQRCNDPNCREFPRYGGRGIRMCDEWKDPKVFYDWSMANGYKDNLTIDRIDFNGNYEPSNCRWATPKEQANNKRNNIYITLDGRTQTLMQWCEEMKQPYPRIQARLYRGWSYEKALYT